MTVFVVGISGPGDISCRCVPYKVFSSKEKAESFVEDENKRNTQKGYDIILDISEMEVE